MSDKERRTLARKILAEALKQVEELGLVTKVTCSVVVPRGEGHHQAWFWAIPGWKESVK